MVVQVGQGVVNSPPFHLALRVWVHYSLQSRISVFLDSECSCSEYVREFILCNYSFLWRNNYFYNFDITYPLSDALWLMIMNKFFNVQFCKHINRVVLRRHISARPRFHAFLSSRSLWTVGKPSDSQLSHRLVANANSQPTTWVDRLPDKVQPYLYLTRIDKPIGTLLLFYPCGPFRLLCISSNS